MTRVESCKALWRCKTAGAASAAGIYPGPCGSIEFLKNLLPIARVELK